MQGQSVGTYGLCVIKDKFFEDFPHNNHMQNKNESRPYFLAIKGCDEIFWLVPISSRVDKYKAKIEKDTEKFGECLFCHIGRIMGRESAFLIGNMIPVTEEYIKKPFTVCGAPYVVQDKELIKQIRTRASRYLALVRAKKLSPYVDILEIERILLNRKENAAYMI